MKRAYLPPNRSKSADRSNSQTSHRCNTRVTSAEAVEEMVRMAKTSRHRTRPSELHTFYQASIALEKAFILAMPESLA